MKAKITPYFWYDNNIEEAMEFYTSVFPDSKVTMLKTYENADPNGNSVVVAKFELAGQEFAGMNAGPEFKFNEAISLYVDCEDQAECDAIWDKFVAAGGTPTACGWINDKWGLSWQIVPRQLDALLDDPDPERAGRAMQAMLKQVKIDIGEIERAANG